LGSESHALTLEGGELPGYVSEVSGEGVRGVLVVSWLAYVLRVYARRLTIHERKTIIMARVSLH
jgi:hypothetical protein